MKYKYTNFKSMGMSPFDVTYDQIKVTNDAKEQV